MYFFSPPVVAVVVFLLKQLAREQRETPHRVHTSWIPENEEWERTSILLKHIIYVHKRRSIKIELNYI